VHHVRKHRGAFASRHGQRRQNGGVIHSPVHLQFRKTACLVNRIGEANAVAREYHRIRRAMQQQRQRTRAHGQPA